MSIINYIYNNAAAFDNADGSVSYVNTPTILKDPWGNTSTVAENFYYKKTYGLYEQERTNTSFARGSLPASFDELWYRVLYKCTSISGAGGTLLMLLSSSNLAQFQIYLGGTTIYHATYNSAGTIVTTTALGVLSLANAQDVAAGNLSLDIRIKLDPSYGYIQIYNYAGTLLFEFIGKTIEAGLTLNRYHLALGYINTAASPSAGVQLFAILATEKTFGMYVCPLKLKAEGSLQQQDAGQTFANIAPRKRHPTELGSLAMTISAGTTKQYTAQLQSMTDIALPANYVVRSLKVSEILECTQQTPTPVIPEILLKTNGVVKATPVAPIVPNSNGAITEVWQTRSVKYDLNPTTGLPWELADFNAMEVGFKLTGA